MGDQLRTQSGESLERKTVLDGGSIAHPDSKSEVIKETGREFSEGLKELVSDVESAELAEGDVSEQYTESRKGAPVSGMTQSGGATVTTKVQIEPPSIEVMQIQIATQINKEIRLLEAEASRLKGSVLGGLKAYELSNVVARMRSLRDILSNLAYATAEMVKTWWKEFVGGR